MFVSKLAGANRPTQSSRSKIAENPAKRFDGEEEARRSARAFAIQREADARLSAVRADEAMVLVDAERREWNYLRRVFYNKTHFSLDADDGIENEMLAAAPSPCELYEREFDRERLYTALAELPDAQARRVYAHYILDISKSEIARREGVDKTTVGESIELGLRSLEKFLKEIF